MQVADDLRALLGDGKVSTSESVLELHAGDLSYHPRRAPAAVVFPESTEDVSRVLAWASEHGVPVVPFGAGTSLEGHVIPPDGAVTLDLARMNRVLEVLPGDLQARAQPGVLRSELNAAVAEHGLWFPVDPGADASLGGMAATNASGTTTVRYGGMRANVLALEVVLADGTVIRPGSRTVKTSAGYDLRSLFVGSEGTLGVITELTLRLHGLPERPVAIRAAFPDVGAACRSAVALVGAGLTVTRCELLDEATLRAVNAYKGTSYAETPSLFVELDGGDDEVASAREVFGWENVTAFEAVTAAEARTQLWDARHNAAFAIAAAAPGKRWFATDVCVPLSVLPDAVEHGRACADRRGIPAGGDRARRGRQLPPRADGRPRGRGRGRRRAGALRRARGLGARAGRHLDRGARDRPRQARLPRARARRPAAVPPGGEGRVRPEGDPEPGQGRALSPGRKRCPRAS